MGEVPSECEAERVGIYVFVQYKKQDANFTCK